jgi:hypothetical protein
MHRLPTSLVGPALALIVLAAVFITPAIATAQPQREAVRSPAERTAAAPSLFAEIRSLLSILWAETGSGLDPDGGATSGASSGTEPGAAPSGDTGSGLDPNG